MPTAKTSPKTNIKTADPVAKENTVAESVDMSKKFEELEAKNAMLTEQLAKLMSTLETMNAKQTGEDMSVSTDDNTDVMSKIKKEYSYPNAPEEISPNKQVLVMSLCYGTLNLRDNATNRTVLSFSRYGQVVPVLYSTLLDVVNSNRRFAEEGKFYILDKSAVYYLGLSESYKNLIGKEVIDKILDYSPHVIESILNVINDEQKELIVKLICDKLYSNANVDINKISAIGKMCRVDFNDKVKEMRRFSNNQK